MNIQLLTVGDELLIGQTTNTNAAWLGERLSVLGVQVERIVTVGDDREAILRELDRAFDSASLVIMTGGLGPTHDDIAREVVAEYLDVGLQTDEEVLDQVRHYYERRNRQLPSAAQKLARIPEGAETLENPVGAALGLWYEDPFRERMLAVLPGIPAEMKAIFDASVQPRLEGRQNVREVIHRTLVTSGIGESSLQERLGDLSGLLGEEVHLAYLPSTSGVRLRLTAQDGDTEAQERLDRLEATIRDRAGSYVIGTGRDTLEEVLGERLREREVTLGVAESATGGLVGHRLTGVGGSSDYFVGGIVAYANSVKKNALHVQEETLSEYGAVSEPVAVQMAEGVREVLSTTAGVATTGIAGPTGGTPEKPVGTVWIGYADATNARAEHHHFVEDRSLNKELFASAALDLVRRALVE